MCGRLWSSLVLVASFAWFGCAESPIESNSSVGEGDDTQAETAAETAAETTGDAAGETTDSSDGEGGCPLGATGCPCTAGGGCDPGLACEQGVCTDSCQLGSVGCPCTPGGACDSGLTCVIGQCSATGDGDGDPTGDGDGDPTGDGDGDSTLPCASLGAACTALDQAACVCETCNNDGECTENEDCVCPDCTDLGFCRGDECDDDGLCHPYFEGCSCSDCAAHPECG